MISKALLPLLSASYASAYFAEANNAHLEFVATGTTSESAASSSDTTVFTVDSNSLKHHPSHLKALEDALAVQPPSLGFSAPHILDLFEAWMKKFEKEYETVEEKMERLLIFLENHVMIESHNAQKSTYTLGHNEYSDLTTDEFHKLMKIGDYFPEIMIEENKQFNFMESSTTAAADSSMLRGAAAAVDDETAAAAVERRRLELAASKSLFPDPDCEVDWGMKGLLGPVRNQGPCGACWAFSTIGAIEAAIAIEKFSTFPSPLDPSNMGLVTPLSEQELIDCDTNYEHGCQGGLMISTFNEEEHRNGLCTEADYPYIENQGTCASSACTPISGSIVKSHVDVHPRQTKLLKEALQVKPVTAAMVASDPMFQFYSKGIFQSPTCGVPTREMGKPDCQIMYENQDTCLPDINHGVLVVGYGTDKKAEGVQDFFKVKNSWGDSWGEGGFFRLARSDTDNPDPKKTWGECAILSMLSYPVMG
mmetsp:Transcript_14292/g.21436  ORF Transcript_14292/g.21436 Transcript_14292/m.21436 type:complete len:478 (+) Transcript_14292:78-1511(+)